MQPVVKNAKSRETEPGCQAYFFFTPKDGNEEVLYGIELYGLAFLWSNEVTMTKKLSRKPTLTLQPSKISQRKLK